MTLITLEFIKELHNIIEHYLLVKVIFDRLTAEDLALAKDLDSERDFVAILANGNPALLGDVRSCALDDLRVDETYGALARLMEAANDNN